MQQSFSVENDDREKCRIRAGIFYMAEIMDQTAIKRDRNSMSAAFRAAFPNTIPVLTGFLVLGIAYGLLMETKGYGIPWSVLMSVFAFGGSMQFAAIALLTTAFDPLQAFLLSILVNARHLFYGLSMLDKYTAKGIMGFLTVFWMCDETYSINSSVEVPDGVNPQKFYFAVSLLDYLYWVGATALGSLIGGLLPFNTAGLDFALTALFAVLFLEQIEKRENRIPGAIGIAATALVLIVLGPDMLVIPSMAVILVILLAGGKKLCI